MASKRGLYKPAQTNVGKKTNRRQLPQGRLESTQPKIVSSAPRLQQGKVNESQVTCISSVIGNDDPNATPRRAVPRAMQHSSPLPTPLAPTLDLSDNEDYSVHTQPQVSPKPASIGVAVHRHSRVMVLDASAHATSPDGTHVEYVVGFEKSPARVICHSQSPSTRTTGVAGEEGVWQVAVGQVPRVNTGSAGGAISPLSESNSETGMRGMEREAESMRYEDYPSSAKKGASSARMPQPNFDESGESEKEFGRRTTGKKKCVGKATAVAGAPEVTSDSDACSLFEYVPQNKNRNKPPTSSSISTKPPGSERKKKGERWVASRYMQSAQSKKSFADVSTLSDKSGGAKRVLGLSGSVGNRSGSAKVGSRKAQILSSRNTSGSSPSRIKTSSSPSRIKSKSSPRRVKSSVSPPRGRLKGNPPQGKTSTPTHDEAPNMVSCDASAINPEISMVSIIDSSHTKLGGSGSFHCPGTNTPRKPSKDKLEPRLRQQRLALAYARYLQWYYLDARAWKVLQEQEKDAMRQVSALWELMMEKQQEKTDLHEDLMRLRHLNKLERQLETQQLNLEPVARVFPKLQKDYNKLSAALDTTRHQIHTRGVHLPEDEDFFLASLEQTLQESEQLLGNLSLMTKKEAPALQDFADAILAVEKTVDAECLELSRCRELLSAVQSLATHENSLRIQAMQAAQL